MAHGTTRLLRLSDADRLAAERWGKLMAGIREAFGPRVPLRRVQALLLVAEQPDVSLGELAALLEVPMATASADLQALGTKDQYGGRGLHLVEQRRDTLDATRNGYRLTPRGEGLLQCFGAIMDR